MKILKSAMVELAKSKGLERTSEESKYANTYDSLLPDGLLKIENAVYEYPANPTTEDLLSMLIYTTSKIEQHVRFIKNIVIAGIVIAVVSLLINLIM